MCRESQGQEKRYAESKSLSLIFPISTFDCYMIMKKAAKEIRLVIIIRSVTIQPELLYWEVST